MKLPAICVSLTLLATLLPEKAAARELVTKGFPWMVFTRAGTEGYQTQNADSNGYQLQHHVYVGTTLKPMQPAWFHLGLHSRYTQLSPWEEPYRDPATLHFTTSIRLIRDLLYAAGGMTLPLAGEQAPLEDSSSIARLLEEPLPLSSPNILPLNILSLNAFLTRSLGPLNAKFGYGYLKPSTYELYDGKKIFPASYMNYRLSLTWMEEKHSHQLLAKVSAFGTERDRQNQEQEAHREGLLIQGRYAYRSHQGRRGMESAIGGAWKFKDKNRVNLVQNRMVREPENSNLQRLYAEWTWVQALTPGVLFTANIAPHLLYRERGEAFGYAGEINPGIKLKGKKARFLQIKGRLFMGELGDDSFFGGGVNISYSLHGSGKNQPGLFPKLAEE